MTSPRDRHDLMALAKKPTPGTKIYRGHRGGEGAESGEVGIHWSTNPDVARGIGTNLHEATIDDPHAQVIPHGALSRRQFNPDTGEVRTPSDANMMGFDWEAEVRLRPGAKLRTNTGEHTVEHRSDMSEGYGGWHSLYKNLGNQSAPGSKAQMRHWGEEQTHLGHVQMAMFDRIGVRDRPDIEGEYVPSIDAMPDRPGGRRDKWGEWMDVADAAHERVAAKHGVEPHIGTEFHELEVKTPPKKRNPD